MKVTPIKDFVKSKGFMSLNPTVRENTNGFPYLTFLNKDGQAENVYFSKSSAGQVAKGVMLDSATLRGISVAEVKNEAGELREKLTFSSYVSLEDLLG
jgi:hypothetical protein